MTKHIQYYEGFPDTPQTRAAITELVELIINCELELQEQGVPIHVIPLRTPKRNAEVRAQVAEERKHFSL